MSSSQALVRVGEPLDLYYTDHANCKKQAIPVEYDTRYSQDFSNKQSGVSVLIIPPNQAVRHALIVLGYSGATMNTITSNGASALPRGWGYTAISQVSFRVGGSSQYFLTGQQLLARNLRLCRTKEQRNALLSLGGAEISGATGTVPAYAYIPVSIWSATGEDELGIPLPTDLLSQQVQITAQLNPASAFWVQNTTGSPASIATLAFDTAYFQIEQLQMKDRGMALANRVNMNEHMYSMPLPTFDQQEVVFQAQSGTAGVPKPYVLTGFRAGEVKKIQVWLSPTLKEANASIPAQTLDWVLPASVEILYAGLKYATYQNGSSAMWNLLDGTAPSAVDNSRLVVSGTGFTSTPVLAQWVDLPFCQPSGSDYEADILIHGKEITNGIVNMNIAFPDNASYDIHVVYVYNATLGFSKGSAEVIF